MERINTDALHFLYPYIRLQAALALPLGELSPQVTERALQPGLNGNVNLFAHTTKIPVDIPVEKSQNLSLRSRRAFSNWLLSFGMVIVCPLRRLRRHLSQRESQVPLSRLRRHLSQRESQVPLSRLRRHLSQRERQVPLSRLRRQLSQRESQVPLSRLRRQLVTAVVHWVAGMALVSPKSLRLFRGPSIEPTAPNSIRSCSRFFRRKNSCDGPLGPIWVKGLFYRNFFHSATASSSQRLFIGLLAWPLTQWRLTVW